jgi:N-acetylglucosaminyl-diphospho-decaprenol L-rhamnosyltransferase
VFDEFGDLTVGVAVPRLVDGGGKLLHSQRREPTVATVFGEGILGGRNSRLIPALSEVIQNTAAYNGPADVTWASGCAWLITDKCWNDVGRWDESFFLYSEDLDYALRVRDAGYRIRFTAEAEVVHLVGPSKTDPRLWSMLIWNRYRLYRRRHGLVLGWLFWTGLVVNEAVRSLKGESIHRAGLRTLLFRSKRPTEVLGR